MRKYYYWLDSLRAVSMLLVVCGHFRNALFPAFEDVPHDIATQIFYLLTRWGHSAVVVFFVLSGFLVGGKAFEQYRRGSFNLRDYTLSRMVRIGLPLGAACLLVGVVFFLLDCQVPWGRILGNFLCLQGMACESLLGPWWALSVEVWFYVFGGSLLGVLTLTGWKRIVCAVVCMGVLGVFLTGDWQSLFVWILGVGAYLCLPKKKSLLRLIAAFAALLSCVVFMMRHSLPDLILGLAVSCVVREVVLWDPSTGLANRVERGFQWLAKYSYTVYLMHMLVMIVLMNGLFTCGKNVVMSDRAYFNLVGRPRLAAFTAFNLQTFGWYLLALLMAFAVSCLVWWLVERNTGRMLKFLQGCMRFRTGRA